MCKRDQTADLLIAPVHPTHSVDVDRAVRDVREQRSRVETPERYLRERQHFPDHGRRVVHLLVALGPGRGELPPGQGRRWSAKDTTRCAVSALEASLSVPLSCLRRPLGRTIGLNQPGDGTITLSNPLRKSRAADRILRLPAGRRGEVDQTEIGRIVPRIRRP